MRTEHRAYPQGTPYRRSMEVFFCPPGKKPHHRNGRRLIHGPLLREPNHVKLDSRDSRERHGDHPVLRVRSLFATTQNFSHAGTAGPSVLLSANALR